MGGTGKFNPVVTQIRELLNGVNDPLKALNFINNLLKATNEVESLKDDLRDPVFLKELIQFGFDYAKLNPNTSLSAEPQGFLDVLWRATPDNEEALQGAIRKGAAGLSEFFEGADTQAKLVKRLTFAKNLIEAAKLAPSTQEQVRDPRFVDALIGLGGAYAAIDPQPETLSPGSRLFLNTIWAGNAQSLGKGVTELNSFLNGFDQNAKRLNLLTYQQKLLKALPLIPELGLQRRDLSFIEELIALARAYALVIPDDKGHVTYDSDPLFLDLLWRFKAEQNIQVGKDQLKSYINEFSNPSNLPPYWIAEYDVSFDGLGANESNKSLEGCIYIGEDPNDSRGTDPQLGVWRYLNRVKEVVDSYNQNFRTANKLWAALPSPLDWRLVAAMMMVESSPPPPPSANLSNSLKTLINGQRNSRRFDPMQVSNDPVIDVAKALRTRPSEPQDGFQFIATPDLIARLALKKKPRWVSVGSDGYWDYYTANTGEPINDIQRMNSQTSIEAGVAWLFTRAVGEFEVKNNVQTVKKWQSWEQAIADYNNRDTSIGACYRQKVLQAYQKLTNWLG